MTRPAFQTARARALLTLGAWCAGILLARSVPTAPPLLWYSIAGTLVAAALLRAKPKVTGLLLVSSALLLATGWTTARTSPNHGRLDQILQLPDAAGSVPLRVRGQIISRTTTRHRAESPASPPRLRPVSRSMRLRVHAVQHADTWIPATGTLTVVLPHESTNPYAAGSIATVLGDYRPPGRATNPGDPDWSALAAQNNRVGTIYADHDELITTQRPGSIAHRLPAAFYSARAWARSRAISAMGLESEQSAAHSVMGTLILGHRDSRFDDAYRVFQRVGIAHMFAISGFHVAIMIALAVLVVRVFGDHPRVESLVMCALIAAILLLLPLRPPILRAVILVAVLLGAGGAGRRYDRLTVLAWIALGLLIARPLDLFSLGYQLSVGVTALLLALPNPAPGTAPTTQSTGTLRSLGAITWRIARTNTACWAVASPAIMLHAGVLTLLAPLTTLIMLPIIVLMMITGYAELLLGFLSPNFTGPIREPAAALAAWATDLTITIDAVPGSSLRAPNLGPLWTILATVFIAAMILIPRSRNPRIAIPSVLALAVWGAVYFGVHNTAGPLRVDMLDVGNGSCILVRSGTEAALFDGGSLDRPVDQTLARAAHRLGARPIRAAFISHDNLDHFNALLDGPVSIGIRVVYTTEALEHAPSEAWRSVREQLLAQGVEIRILHAGDHIEFGQSVIDVLWPPAGLDPSTEENNTSLVLHIQTETRSGQRSVLLCGDIETEAMNTLLDEHPALRADILEAPHHGSANPALLRFIDRLDPAVILQSTGRGRLNDPRLAGVRDRTDWLSTAEHGAVFARIRIDGTIDRGPLINDR